MQILTQHKGTIISLCHCENSFDSADAQDGSWIPNVLNHLLRTTEVNFETGYTIQCYREVKKKSFPWLNLHLQTDSTTNINKYMAYLCAGKCSLKRKRLAFQADGVEWTRLQRQKSVAQVQRLKIHLTWWSICD